MKDATSSSTALIGRARSRLLVAAFAVLAALVLAACGGDDDADDDAAAERGELEKTELVLQIGPDPAFATQAVAIEKGWFEEAGFTDVSTETFAAGVEAGEAVARGDIDLWSPGNLPPITLRQSGAPIVILANNAIARVESLIAREDAGIEDPEDLQKGGRVAVLEGSTQSAYLSNLAEHYGLDLDEIETVNLDPPEELTALVSGDVDAMVNFTPFTFQAPEQTEAVELAGRQSGFAVDDGEEVDFSNTRNVFATSEQFVRDNPNAAEAMLEVLLRAQAYVADPENRDEVFDITAEFLDVDREIIERSWAQYEFTPDIDEAYVEDMQAYTDFLAGSGALEGDPLDPLDYTSTEILERLQPDAVQVSGEPEP